MKTCMNCNNAEAEHGMDCPRCDTLLVLTAIVMARCLPADLADLSATLRSASVFDLRRERKGAKHLQYMLNVLSRFCFMRNLDENQMKTSLAKRIDTQLAHIIRVEKWQEENKAEYLPLVSRAMGEAMEQAFRQMDTKVKPMPVPA